jgi:6-phosphogluconolactonase (cycloisomerase 2 family)
MSTHRGLLGMGRSSGAVVTRGHAHTWNGGGGVTRALRWMAVLAVVACSPLAASRLAAGGRSLPSGGTLSIRQAAGGGAYLVNSSQDLAATISPKSVSVVGIDGITVGLGSVTIGRGAVLSHPLFGAPAPAGDRVMLGAAGLDEWFVNTPSAIEQGFTVTRRPAGHSPLVISQRLMGNADARVTSDGRTVFFSTLRGRLEYTNLVVRDSRGARVPAHLNLAGRQLRIVIDDAGAGYPLRVDPGILSPVVQNPGTNADTGTYPRALAFSPNGDFLAVANYQSGTVSMFSVAANGQLTPIGTPTAAPAGEYPSYAPQGVAFSPNGDLLATSDYEDSSVALFTVSGTGALTAITQNTPANADTGSDPLGLQFSPSGSLLAVPNGSSSTVSMYTVTGGGQLTPVTQSPTTNGDADYGPDTVSFSPNGSLLATANGINDTVSVFTVSAGGALTPITQNPASNADAGADTVGGTFSPSGTLFVTVNQGGTLSVFGINGSGALSPVAQNPASNADTGDNPYAIAFSPNGALVAVPNATDDTISLFEISSSGALTPITQTPASNGDTSGDPYSIAWSPNGNLIATSNIYDSSTTEGNDVSVFGVTGGSVSTGTTTTSTEPTTTSTTSAPTPSAGALSANTTITVTEDYESSTNIVESAPAGALDWSVQPDGDSFTTYQVACTDWRGTTTYSGSASGLAANSTVQTLATAVNNLTVPDTYTCVLTLTDSAGRKITATTQLSVVVRVVGNNTVSPSGGFFAVGGSCGPGAGEAPCSGSGSVSASVSAGSIGMVRLHSAKKKHTVKLVLANGKFTIPPGTHKIIKLKLTSKGRTYLHKHHTKLKATITLTYNAKGHTSTSSWTLNVK